MPDTQWLVSSLIVAQASVYSWKIDNLMSPIDPFKLTTAKEKKINCSAQNNEAFRQLKDSSRMAGSIWIDGKRSFLIHAMGQLHLIENGSEIDGWKIQLVSEHQFTVENIDTQCHFNRAYTLTFDARDTAI